jgi:glutamate dehydrogenase (NAD(P)+)
MAPASIRVLLVEDNPLHSRLLTGLLGGATGPDFPIVVEKTLQTATERASRDEFDVVLLDLVLPDSRGLDTLLRFRGHCPDVPVVVLTGLDDMDFATRALEHGAQDYLLKTQINAALLHRSLRYAVERGEVDHHEWDSPALRVAHQQFMKAAQVVGLSDGLRQKWLFPRRTVQLFLASPHSDGMPIVAYRVQHLPEKRITFGGIRQHATVTRGEITALAMQLSWQSALFGLPFGGAFGGLRLDPKSLSAEAHADLLESYLRELSSPRDHTDLVGPGLGTAQTLNALKDTGRTEACAPECVCIPDDAIAVGVGALIDELAPRIDVDLMKATAVVQGFGAMGKAVASLFQKLGIQVLAVSDEHGGIHSTDGLDIDEVIRHTEAGHALRRFSGASTVSNQELLRLPCDVLVPAAVSNQITAENAGNLHCSLIAELACGAVTMEADEVLRSRNITVLPSLLANGGGSLYAHLSRPAEGARGLDDPAIFKEIRARLVATLTTLLDRCASDDLDLRSAAMASALETLREAQ